MVILGTLESTSPNELVRCSLKWFIFNIKTQNLEFVNLKRVTYAQPIPEALSPFGNKPSFVFRQQK